MVIVGRVGHNTSISRIYFTPLSPLSAGPGGIGLHSLPFFAPGRKGTRDNRMVEGEEWPDLPRRILHNSVAAVPDLCVCLSCFGS